MAAKANLKADIRYKAQFNRYLAWGRYIECILDSWDNAEESPIARRKLERQY